MKVGDCAVFSPRWIHMAKSVWVDRKVGCDVGSLIDSGLVRREVQACSGIKPDDINGFFWTSNIDNGCHIQLNFYSLKPGCYDGEINSIIQQIWQRQNRSATSYMGIRVKLIVITHQSSLNEAGLKRTDF